MDNNKKLFFVVTLLISNVIFAEQTTWKLKGMLGATLNQTVVSDNWSGTEKNAYSWSAKLNISAERDAIKTNWLNVLKDEFGKVNVVGFPEQKSVDLFDFSSVFRWKLTRLINPYLSFVMTTQNDEFLYPVTYSESAGVGLSIIQQEKQNLITRLGLAFRQTYDKIHRIIDPVTLMIIESSAIDDPSTIEIETSKMDTGLEWVTNYDLLFMQNAKFISEARLFTAFKGGANIRWDNSLYLQISKLVTMQVGYLVIYNYDKNPRPTWPEGIETHFSITLGFAFNLF